MAYDLHLVRTSNWLDAADAPVTKEDVDALLLSDAELTWSMDHIEMKLEGEAKRPHLIEWKGEPFFGCYKDQIRFNNSDQDALIKLIGMADALNGAPCIKALGR